MMEYIRLYWEHNFDDEPIVIFYEVCVEAERLAKRSIDVYANGETKNMDYCIGFRINTDIYRSWKS